MSILLKSPSTKTDVYSNDKAAPGDATSSGSGGESHSSSLISTRGAFHGSDIAVTGLATLTKNGSLETSNGSTALLVYQHYTGELRWMQHIDPENWYGGTADDILASDAKNGTPIDMTVSWSPGVELHLFCMSGAFGASASLLLSELQT